MLDAVSYALIAALCCLGFIYPPAALLVYALTSRSGDGFGVSGFLTESGFGQYVALSTLPLYIGCGKSLFDIRIAYSRRRLGVRTWVLALLFVAAMAYMAIGSLVKGTQVISVPAVIAYTGLPVAIIAIRYYHDRTARALIFALVLIQLSIAVLIVVIPDSPLSVINAVNYNPGDVDVSRLNWTYQGEVSRLTNQERMYGQFHNPDAYGLYAVVGICLGSIVALRAKTRWIFAGSALLVVALFGWTVTLSRGATAGLTFGAVLCALGFYRHAISRKLIQAIAFLALLLAIALAAGVTGQGLIELFTVRSDDLGLGLRLDAISQGWEFLRTSPLFGADLQVEWVNKVLPHQIMLYFAAMYGIPVGLAVLVLFIVMVWACLTAFASHGRQNAIDNLGHLPSPRDTALGVVLGAVAIGTGLTNNFSASVIFWLCWAAAVVPWASRGYQFVAPALPVKSKC